MLTVPNKFSIIEPHPDDALGSAAGLCFNPNLEVQLHTLTKSNDERDDVSFVNANALIECKAIFGKPTNIIQHNKYWLPDLHWDCRLGKEKLSFVELIETYKNEYPAINELHNSTKRIVEDAKREDAYLIVPLGIAHPMHILAMATTVECIKELEFNKNKVLFYADHPYDYFLIDSCRLEEIKDFILENLNMELLRCDDTSIEQGKTEKLIRHFYGNLHFGEFAGSLDKTHSSFFLSPIAAKELVDPLKLSCNNVLFITMQANPFKRTGGLGKVAYEYCREQKNFVNDIRIFMPKYKSGEPTIQNVAFVEEYCFTYHRKDLKNYICKIEKYICSGIVYYLMSMRDETKKYLDFEDSQNEGENIALFCDALLKVGLKAIDFVPNILHCNDWQSGLIPFLKRAKYSVKYKDLKTVYTIHCYAFKGVFPKKEIFNTLELDDNTLQAIAKSKDKIDISKLNLLSKEEYDQILIMEPSMISYTKAGIHFADVVSTVSVGYAQELMSYPDFKGIHVVGIRNGIASDARPIQMGNGEYWTCNPDSYDNFWNFKKENKRDLQNMLGFENSNNPMICIVSRLSLEKGMETLKNLLPYLVKLPVQIVICGDDAESLTKPYGTFFDKYAEMYPKSIAYKPYTEQLEYKIYAGADILLMPSLAESCGTAQMQAMRYGILPVVSMLSAIRDTVVDYRYIANRPLDKGIGFFSFRDNSDAFFEVLQNVVNFYFERNDEWRYIARAICAKTDFSWKNGPLAAYVDMYNGLTAKLGQTLINYLLDISKMHYFNLSDVRFSPKDKEREMQLELEAIEKSADAYSCDTEYKDKAKNEIREHYWNEYGIC